MTGPWPARRRLSRRHAPSEPTTARSCFGPRRRRRVGRRGGRARQPPVLAARPVGRRGSPTPRSRRLQRTPPPAPLRRAPDPRSCRDHAAAAGLARDDVDQTGLRPTTMPDTSTAHEKTAIPLSPGLWESQVTPPPCRFPSRPGVLRNFFHPAFPVLPIVRVMPPKSAVRIARTPNSSSLSRGVECRPTVRGYRDCVI